MMSFDVTPVAHLEVATRAIMEDLLGRHSSTPYAEDYWLKIYTRKTEYLDIGTTR